MFATTRMATELGLRAGFLLDYVAALRPQGMGGWLRGGIVAGQTGKFQPRNSLNYRFQKGVSVRNMSGYPRWSRRPCISFEMYPTNLAGKANAT